MGGMVMAVVVRLAVEPERSAETGGETKVRL